MEIIYIWAAIITIITGFIELHEYDTINQQKNNPPNK